MAFVSLVCSFGGEVQVRRRPPSQAVNVVSRSKKKLDTPTSNAGSFSRPSFFGYEHIERITAKKSRYPTGWKKPVSKDIIHKKQRNKCNSNGDIDQLRLHVAKRPVLSCSSPKVDQSHQRFHGSTGGVLVEGSIDLIQVDVAKSLRASMLLSYDSYDNDMIPKTIPNHGYLFVLKEARLDSPTSQSVA